MAKKIKNKPLRKYQQGGDPNQASSPWASGFGNPFSSFFPTSGLLNPSFPGVENAIFGRVLPPTSGGSTFINLGDNPFGNQLMAQTQSTANLLGTMPGLKNALTPLTPQQASDRLVEERGFVKSGGKWISAAGEEYSKDEFVALQDAYLQQENKKIEQNKKFAPMITPLIQLNELGEMQKQSYNQAQKESMYDVTKSPMSMENKGFFAREGMRTPPISQVYRMIGAHQGLPETNYRLLNLKAKKEYQQGGNVNFLDDILYGEDEVESFQDSGQVKTNNKDVAEIKKMLQLGEVQKVIAQKFGISKKMVTDINTGRTWKHIKI